MKREFHVRFCERLEVKFLGSTYQRNEASQGAGYQSREAYPSGSHTPDQC